VFGKRLVGVGVGEGSLVRVFVLVHLRFAKKSRLIGARVRIASNLNGHRIILVRFEKEATLKSWMAGTV
jgi:hypothetical protein